MTKAHVTSGLLLLACLSACGGAAERPASPATGGAVPSTEWTPEPKTVQEAQEQIGRAAKEIAEPAHAGAARSEESKPTSDATKTDDASSKKAPACATPCRAIRSMRRAVDALCRMTGDGDAACMEAKKTLADNEARVATCGC